MADIVIRGMEIPKDRNWKAIRIYPDGTCSVLYWQGDYKILPCTAFFLPEGHGRLIDADALMSDFAKATWEFRDGYTFQQLLEHAPTIVPAEGGEANEKPV